MTVKKLTPKHYNYPDTISQSIRKLLSYRIALHIVSLFKCSKVVNIITLRLIISYQIVNDFCRRTSQTL
jgi:hypothetical protein